MGVHHGAVGTCVRRDEHPVDVESEFRQCVRHLAHVGILPAIRTGGGPRRPHPTRGRRRRPRRWATRCRGRGGEREARARGPCPTRRTGRVTYGAAAQITAVTTARRTTGTTGCRRGGSTPADRCRRSRGHRRSPRVGARRPRPRPRRWPGHGPAACDGRGTPRPRAVRPPTKRRARCRGLEQRLQGVREPVEEQEDVVLGLGEVALVQARRRNDQRHDHKARISHSGDVGTAPPRPGRSCPRQVRTR